MTEASALNFDSQHKKFKLFKLQEEAKSFMRAIQSICIKYEKLFDVNRADNQHANDMRLSLQTSAVPYIMGHRNAPSGEYANEDLSFWTFHVNIYPPLLNKGRKKFMAGYEVCR